MPRGKSYAIPFSSATGGMRHSRIFLRSIRPALGYERVVYIVGVLCVWSVDGGVANGAKIL